MPREKSDLQAKLRDVPHQPGVYLMRDRLHRVIYVGKARDLRKRLASYFVPSNARRADLKTRALIDSIWDFDLQLVKNDTEALILEGRLIKEFRPKYNISFRDDKRFLLLRVRLDDPFPRFTLTRLKKDDGARYLGPFVHSAALRTTINWLNKRFGLRVCRPLRPDESDYKHCSNDIIKNCSAPCIGRLTPEHYRLRVEEACSFFEGKAAELIAGLEAEMQSAAARFDFEKAAELRDMIEHLRQTVRPTRTFERGARMRALSSRDPMADVRELQDALRLERPPLVMECFDIANIGTAHCVASMVRFTRGAPDTASYRRYRIQIVSGQNDFAAMAEVIRRRYSRILQEARRHLGESAADFTQEVPIEALRRMERRGEDGKEKGEGREEKGEDRGEKEEDSIHPAPDPLSSPHSPLSSPHSPLSSPHSPLSSPHSPLPSPPFPRLPDLIIVDGGKGQLSAALAELRRLGLHGLPIIGLAKEHEEIYRPGDPQPLQLPHELGALKLLQRIRDEAHRWANSYHQLLLARRVQESLLDDCPGISAGRKAALLRRFGSVARLRKATPAQLAQTPGIGKALAEQLAAFLAER